MGDEVRVTIKGDGTSSLRMNPASGLTRISGEAWWEASPCRCIGLGVRRLKCAQAHSSNSQLTPSTFILHPWARTARYRSSTFRVDSRGNPDGCFGNGEAGNGVSCGMR